MPLESVTEEELVKLIDDHSAPPETPKREYILQFLSLANGQPSALDGHYLVYYDAKYVSPWGYDGGLLETTPEREKAKRFPDAASAMEKWNEIAPKPYDVRPDGKKNKPLTCWSVVVEPYHAS